MIDIRWLVRSVVVLAPLMICGCGNQMFRQPSYEPLDTPRAEEPVGSIPVDPAAAPTDARPVVSPAYGDLAASAVAPSPSSFPVREPDLPPPNLSDNARYMAAPKAVDAFDCPYPINDSRLISAGSVLFLNRCVQCHNAGGYGYGVVGSYLDPHPPDLASKLVQKNSDGALFWHITMGQGKMPAFRSWTTPAERWELTAYVRSLKHARLQDERLLTAHISDTTGTPYPVYGEPGFELGKNTAAFKVLGGAPSPYDSRVYTDPSQPEELINRVPQ